MKTTLIFLSVGIGAAAIWIWWSRKGGAIAQRVVGAVVVSYGLYLSTLTASVLKFVIPGIGAIGTGAATGAGIGVATSLFLGTLGVATGGTGYAVGAGILALAGGSLGAVGAATGGFGFQVFQYPVVHPIFWLPLIAIGLTLLLRPKSRKKGEER